MVGVLLIPTAGQCLQVVGPVVLVLGTLWFWRNGDLLLARLFPQWEWERKLGWLNLRANRRAEGILRILTHVLHAALLVALVGILVLCWNLGQPLDTDSLVGMVSIAGAWFYLLVCLGFWIYYFACILAPRVRDEYEAAELARYRMENPEIEKENRAGDRFNVTVWEPTRPRRF